MDNKLEPCPFCGSDANVYDGGKVYSSVVICNVCKAEGQTAITAFKAIENWNRRAALASSATTEQPSDLAAAIQRVQQYMARRKKARALDFEHIHGFDVGPNCGFELLASDIQSLLAALAKQVPAQEQDKWISVDERLPELNQEVLIWCGYRTLAQRSDDQHDPENHQGWCVDFDNGNAKAISHWMPLPPAPAQLAQSADTAEG
jgi:Lar family restriction alleviation protein